MLLNYNDFKIAVLGLGYVGLPLALAFGEKYDVMGFDISERRVSDLKQGIDATQEIEKIKFENSKHIKFTTELNDLSGFNIYIITVPTPISINKKPDLSYLFLATKSVSGLLKQGDIVIYESTVYPGCTEDECVPILECGSGLEYNKDFFCGFSPERINPGDKKNQLKDIVKVVSGSNQLATEQINNLYKSIITAGTYVAESIMVAEMAKVIENTQRDLNIALINEVAIVCGKLGISSSSVLDAAATKWNFHRFEPGLVGGHCISVDPYYLTHKSDLIGVKTEVILAGRKLNDSMPKYVAENGLQALIKRKVSPLGAKALIMGATFKENCSDLRNSKSLEIIPFLESYGFNVEVFDPWIVGQYSEGTLNFSQIDYPKTGHYELVVIAVRHDKFKEMGPDEIRSFCSPSGVIYDLKHVLPIGLTDLQL